MPAAACPLPRPSAPRACHTPPQWTACLKVACGFAEQAAVLWQNGKTGMESPAAATCVARWPILRPAPATGWRARSSTASPGCITRIAWRSSSKATSSRSEAPYSVAAGFAEPRHACPGPCALRERLWRQPAPRSPVPSHGRRMRAGTARPGSNAPEDAAKARHIQHHVPARWECFSAVRIHVLPDTLPMLPKRNRGCCGLLHTDRQVTSDPPTQRGGQKEEVAGELTSHSLG